MKITDKNCLDKDEWWCDWYACPDCDPRDSGDVYQTGNIARHFNYCPICGGKIEWEAKER